VLTITRQTGDREPVHGTFPVSRTPQRRLSTQAGLLLFQVFGALASIQATAPDLRAQGRNVPSFSDSHVHLNSAGAWVANMDRFGVDRVIALAGRNVDNAGLLVAGQRWPGRVLPFLSVSPEHREFRPAWEADDERLTTLVDSLLSSGGFYGIGEISAAHFARAGFPESDFDPSGRTMRGLLGLARKHGLPIMIHAEITRLRELERLLADFRDVSVIWAHGGYTPLFLARRVLNAHPNLIYELSARTWRHHPASPEYSILKDDGTVWAGWLALMEEMPERFLVGTDASGRSETTDREALRGVHHFLSQLSEPARQKIARDNLTRILKLAP
jgi:hypothetical protein